MNNVQCSFEFLALSIIIFNKSSIFYWYYLASGMNKYMVIACSCVLNLNEGQKMRHCL